MPRSALSPGILRAGGFCKKEGGRSTACRHMARRHTPRQRRSNANPKLRPICSDELLRPHPEEAAQRPSRRMAAGETVAMVRDAARKSAVADLRIKLADLGFTRDRCAAP